MRPDPSPEQRDPARWVDAAHAAEAEAAARVAALRAKLQAGRASAPVATVVEELVEVIDVADLLEEEIPGADVKAKAAPPPVPVARAPRPVVTQVRDPRRRPLPGLPPETPSALLASSTPGARRARRSFTKEFRDVIESDDRASELAPAP